jgi:hypothetical protein
MYRVDLQTPAMHSAQYCRRGDALNRNFGRHRPIRISFRMSPATSKRSSWSIIQLPSSLVVCLLAAASGCPNNVPSASAASRLVGVVPTTAFALAAPERRASPTTTTTTGTMNYPPEPPPHDARSSIKTTALMMGSRRGKGGNLSESLTML